MAISDKLMSIANMTKGAMSDKDRAKFAEMAPQQLSPSQEKELEEFRLKFGFSPRLSPVVTRDPDKTLDQPTSDVRTSRIMDFFRNMNVDKADKPDMKTMSMPTRSPDGSITAREVQVAGEFEDMLMKNYESAVEQGYKGTFFDFLIDQMDEEFDPSSPMRVSKLPEGIMQIMKMMQDRKKV